MELVEDDIVEDRSISITGKINELISGFLLCSCCLGRPDFSRLPWTNAGSPNWQAEADSVSSVSASPATAVGQLTLALANWQ